MSESKFELLETINDLANIAVEHADFTKADHIGVVLGLFDYFEEVASRPDKRTKRERCEKSDEEMLENSSPSQVRENSSPSQVRENSPTRQVKEKRKRKMPPENNVPRYVRESRPSFVQRSLASDEFTFFSCIGMDESIFNYILDAIKGDISKQDTHMRQCVRPDEKLAAALHFLGTGDSYTGTSTQTGLSGAFLLRAVPEVCVAIWDNFKDEYLKFPTTKQEWELIAEEFDSKWQFPHCLGALDAKHIEFLARRKDGTFYNNFKGSNSIVLLSLVDADSRFTYINVGCSGSYEDAEVLHQSELKTVLDEPEEHFPEDKLIGNGRKLPYVLLADDAFPLERNLMIPYTHNASIEGKQIFNIRLLRARHVVDHAFANLATRFRIFQNKMNLKVENVELYTKTCCLLHNLLSKKNETYMLPSTDTVLETEVSTSPNAGDGNIEAQMVRQGFEDYFSNEGQVDWIVT